MRKDILGPGENYNALVEQTKLPSDLTKEINDWDRVYGRAIVVMVLLECSLFHLG